MDPLHLQATPIRALARVRKIARFGRGGGARLTHTPTDVPHGGHKGTSLN